jgi:general secretion pathway protein D
MQAPGPQDGRSGQDAARFSMSFDKADAQSVIKYFSMICRVPVVVDPELRGNITIICSGRLTLQEMYEVINAALRVRGYTMVGGLSSKVIRVIPLKRAVTDATGVVSGKDLKSGAVSGELITQVVPLEYVGSDKLRDELKSLVSSDQASIISISSANTLIITDNTDNIRRMMDIIKGVDKYTLGAIEVQIYQCRFASAESLVTTLNTLFQPKTSATTANATVQMRGAQGQPGSAQGAAAAQSGSGLIDMKGEVHIAADPRTNRLVISGTRERVESVISVAKDLDVDVESEIKVKFFTLQYADAKTVADQLNNLFVQSANASTTNNRNQFRAFMPAANTAQTQPGDYAGLKRNVVVADIRTNSVIVTATEQNMRAFESMIKELDAPKVLSEITRVYPLKYATAATLATTLTRLFSGNTSSSSRSSYGIASIFGLGSSSTLDANSPLAQLKNITVIAEAKTNSLLVTGPPNSAALISDLISKLDKSPAQVFIEVAIVDVTLTDDTKFGVEWEWNNTDGGNTHNAKTDFGLADETLGFKYNVIGKNVKALLFALRSRDNVKVLSTPTITTADNVEAKISIGEDQPYITGQTKQSDGSIVTTVDFKKVAVALTVTPHVNDASDLLSLDVLQTINEIIGYNTDLNAPVIADRQAQTSISVHDGQTIVIGGIIKENNEQYTKAVPILSSIPLIGELFKSKQNVAKRSELMVFLTPHILRTEQDVTDVTQDARNHLSIKPQPRFTTDEADPVPNSAPIPAAGLDAGK